MSVRGVISGVAGSAAVAVVAALSLGMTHAAADPKRPAHAQVTPAAQSGAAPAFRPADGPAMLQPTWLRRLLQRSDPPMEPAPMETKVRRS